MYVQIVSTEGRMVVARVCWLSILVALLLAKLVLSSREDTREDNNLKKLLASMVNKKALGNDRAGIDSRVMFVRVGKRGAGEEVRYRRTLPQTSEGPAGPSDTG